MTRTLFPDAMQWAEEHFGGVDLSLESRRTRLLYSVAKLAQQPGDSLPAVFSRTDLRCFYSLVHRRESTHSALLAAHFALTKRAMNTSDAILIVHDTTELDFTSHKALRDQLGPIGDGHGHGLLQHNSLAVRAEDGLLLGLVHQQLVNRTPAPHAETRTQRRHRERESVLWEQGFRGVGVPPEGACWVDVCDRGADIFEALHASVELGHHALIRACQDRCVRIERDGKRQPAYLMQAARSLEAETEDVVQVRQKGGRPARQAAVKLAACRVWIEPPKNLPQREQYGEIEVWIIRIWEEDPPEGEEALEWVLLSTLPARTVADLLRFRDWYARRWPTAEDYHQAEKTGCGEEKVRFQDAASLKAILAILSVVAVRVIQLRQLARACPEEPAERISSPQEITVLQTALGMAISAWTVLQFVRAVAKLGGFLGRKCDGEPGWKTLWRGYRKLQTLMEGVRLAEQMRLEDISMGNVPNGDPTKPP